MSTPSDIFKKYATFQNFFKSFFVVIVLFLIFFMINLFVTVKNKPESAYDALNGGKDSMSMLQDTRLHNWSEIKKE